MRIDNLNANFSAGLSKPAASRISQPSASGTQNSIAPANETTTTNAMIMMQKAQSIVSQALSVSSRLKSIAAETLSTGKTNMEEVSREIASIDSQLGQFGTGVTQAPANADQKATVDQIKQEFNALKAAAKNSDAESADQIMGRLSKINADISNKISAMEKNVISPEILQKTPASLAAESTAGIKANPEQYLAAQGNIATGTAHSLI